jgi:molybdopterin converting factor small subunit
MCPNIDKEIFMKMDIGLWIDHRKAVIVIVSDEGEDVKEITSHMEKHVRYSNDTSEGGSSEDMRDRQFENRLNSFYDAVVAVIRDGDTVQIFGPGEAKGELKKRLESAGFKGHILAIETADKMTDRQIAARVREQLQKKQA